MIDAFIAYVLNYGLFIVLSLITLKILLLWLHRGFNLEFMALVFFKVYKKNEQQDDEASSKRRFKRVHNALTLLFYVTAITWALIFYFFRNIFN